MMDFEEPVLTIQPEKFLTALSNHAGIRDLPVERYKMLSPYILLADFGIGYGLYLVIAETLTCFTVVPSGFVYEKY